MMPGLNNGGTVVVRRRNEGLHGQQLLAVLVIQDTELMGY
jgi:hypothetical protein